MESKCSIPLLSGEATLISAVSVWNSQLIEKLSFKERDELRAVVDGMGKKSAVAQRLKVPVTDYAKLLANAHQNLYLWTIPINSSDPEMVLVVGLLKTGVKKLYIMRNNGHYSEISPLCVLDFYVHENFQRTGIGYKLFEAMLQYEDKKAYQLGYDRPSTKLMSFLTRHYCLSQFIPQIKKPCALPFSGRHFSARLLGLAVVEAEFYIGACSLQRNHKSWHSLLHSTKQPNRFVVFEKYFEDTDFIGDLRRKNHYLRSFVTEHCGYNQRMQHDLPREDMSLNSASATSSAAKRNHNQSDINHSETFGNQHHMIGIKNEDFCLEAEISKKLDLKDEREKNSKTGQRSLKMLNRYCVWQKYYQRKQMSGLGVADALVWSN